MPIDSRGIYIRVVVLNQKINSRMRSDNIHYNSGLRSYQEKQPHSILNLAQFYTHNCRKRKYTTIAQKLSNSYFSVKRKTT